MWIAPEIDVNDAADMIPAPAGNVARSGTKSRYHRRPM